MEKYKVIHTNAINIGGIKREVDKVFEADRSNEIKTLLLNKYIREVKQ